MPKGTRKVDFVFDEAHLTHYSGAWLIQQFCDRLRLRSEFAPRGIVELDGRQPNVSKTPDFWHVLPRWYETDTPPRLIQKRFCPTSSERIREFPLKLTVSDKFDAFLRINSAVGRLRASLLHNVVR